MDGERIHDRLPGRADPQREPRERPVRVAQAAAEDGGHLLAVLGAITRRDEVEQER